MCSGKSLGKTGELIINTIKNKISRSEWLKEYGKILGLAQLGVFSPTLIASGIITDMSNENYAGKYDISFTGDGRTVFMKSTIDKIINDPKYKDKKILSITGDAHASGIDYYNKNDNQFQYDLKKMFYEIVYFLHKRLP